ncbi:MAG: Bax inhibitor-1/YccA family protein [Candidatus Paracaedibacteraceae bacterium]|nr:Bax inhibitor-1/YccA family protein [Candidatus Paracaedibacteraceae bacterium]
MSRFDDQPISRNSATLLAIDEGLRTFMLRVYNYMALGLGLTGVVAYLLSTNQQLMSMIFGSPLGYVFMFAPFALVLFISFRLDKIQASTAQMLFWAYAGLMGISLSVIFMIYTGQSVARMFFVTASLFGSMSLYGYTTKKDLTSMGSFMMMGVWGIILASLVNMFFKSSAMQMLLSVLTVIVFTGLTAYDTQKIKEVYYESDSADVASKKAVMGALTLYIDFINIFLSLLRLFGERR